jgi:hypothetical protein
MAELTQEEVEAVAEALPEFTEAMVGISKGFAALGAVCVSAASAVAGYVLAMKRLEDKYAAVAEDEIDSMRDHFRKQLIARDEKPNLGDLGKKVEALGYMPTPDNEKNISEPSSPGSPCSTERLREPAASGRCHVGLGCREGGSRREARLRHPSR